jgi:16S rRNA (adenine(1408)-N(1))-methyltransferase
LTAAYRHVVVDLGTGDGRSISARSTGRPDVLAIGIDADAASMAEASRKVMRAAKGGGLPRALFVVAAAEALPCELDGCADALTVQFPWGSLLRGVLTAESAILAGISRLTRPGATVTMLLSVAERDRLTGLEVLEERTFAALAPSYAGHGLLLREARPATAEQIAAAHSSWAKRLLANSTRPVWYVRFERAEAAVLEGWAHTQRANLSSWTGEQFINKEESCPVRPYPGPRKRETPFD